MSRVYGCPVQILGKFSSEEHLHANMGEQMGCQDEIREPDKSSLVFGGRGRLTTIGTHSWSWYMHLYIFMILELPCNVRHIDKKQDPDIMPLRTEIGVMFNFYQVVHFLWVGSRYQDDMDVSWLPRCGTDVHSCLDKRFVPTVKELAR